MTTQHIEVKALLFDMDGTLIQSSGAVTQAWQLLQRTGYPFLDLPSILRSAHGYRTVDALRKWCLITDEELLKKEVVRFEEAILAGAKAAGTEGGGIVALPGVKQLLDDIEDGRPADAQGWAVCTSSTHFYASQALPLSGLRVPTHFVTAESVLAGKPAPDPYLLGATLSGCRPHECIVVEDAPTGIRSGKASGARVLATCTSHKREALEAEEPDWCVDDLSQVSALRHPDGSITLSIHTPSQAPTPDDTPLPTPSVSRVPSPVNGMPGMKKLKSGQEISDDPDDVGARRGLKAMQAF